jgi:Zn-dependent protease with chaperone function
MDEERWLQLVARLEAQAQDNSKAYRRKVVRFAALGYAYIVLALASVLALAAGVVYTGIHHGAVLKLLLPIGALALLILRSLAVHIGPPEGVPVSRAEAPALYVAIDDVNRVVRGPSLHAVLLDADMNAGVVQVPRLGVFGSRNYLVLGLPLLHVLTPVEFRAVLAHEFAHLSRRHGRLTVWIYRIRATWDQLLSSLEERQSAATGVFRRFFEWYVPRFNAHAFPLMRAHEFEADRIAASAEGTDALGRALGRLAVANGFLETRYWPSVFKRVKDERTPPQAALTQLAGDIRNAAADHDSARWLTAALLHRPDETDSHPGLTNRLEALGLEADALQMRDDEQACAAEAFLGDHASAVCERLDARWQRGIAIRWTNEYRRVQKELAELEGLEVRRSSLGLEGLLTLARLTDEYRSPEEALARYREVLDHHSDNAVARYSVGRILLDKADDGGLAELDRAVELDAGAIIPASLLAIPYLQERGREGDAARYQERADRRNEELAGASAERDSFTFEDPFEPAELPPEVELALQKTLAAFPQIERAHVGRRHLEHLADEFPAYVVLVVAGKIKRREGEPTLAASVAHSIELPGDFHVFIRRGRSDDVKRFEEKVPVPVYSRD